jgi:nucleoside-diphosphate-sugar epimerase
MGKYRDFYDTNVVGTRNVIKLCKKHNIKKIIFISTPSIYFTGNDHYNISNGDPISVKEWFIQVLTIFNRPFKPKNVPEPVEKIIAGISKTRHRQHNNDRTS